MRDLYEVLGVGAGAPDEEIKAAFRRLAKQLHPDLHPGDAEAAGDYDRAIDDCSEAIRLNPCDADAYSLRGLMYLSTKNYGHARADLRKALSIDPGHQRSREALKLLGVQP
jgi:tetratricopeptide (TPR) repeat protein